MGRPWLWAALAVVGCGSWEPPRHVELQHLGPIRSRDVDTGEHIFLTLCAACHRGRVNPEGYHWTPGQMRHQIREGNRMMPPISERRLTDAQVEAVLAYLSTIGAIEGELPQLPPPRDPRWIDRGVVEESPVPDLVEASEAESEAESEEPAPERPEAPDMASPEADVPGSGRALGEP